MPQNKTTTLDPDAFMKDRGAINVLDNPITDPDAFMQQRGPDSAATRKAMHPTTPAEINKQLPSGASPVGQRPLTLAEKELTATTPPSVGPHGESVPAGPQPFTASINPVTNKPFPGQTKPNTPEQNWAFARGVAPWAAASIPAVLGQPELSLPARALTAGILGAGAKAGTQFFDPERPDSAAARGLDILETGAMVGGSEVGLGLLNKGGKALMRRYFPEIADAVAQGTEKFLKAVPSNDIGVRANYEIAQGDLQAIAKKMLSSRSPLGIESPGGGVFSREAPGGIASTEMRPTELYTAIKDHLDDMYTSERAWQIQSGTSQGLHITPKFAQPQDADVFADAMRRVARIPNLETRAHEIAARVAANPTAPISIADADTLEQATSTMLRKFRAGTGSKQAVDLGTQRNTTLMENADSLLNEAMNSTLQGAGQPGINGYARRYAALARVMDNLERMIPATERGRFGLGPMDITSPSGIAKTLSTMIGKNPGRKIEDALRILARAPEIPRPTGIPITPPGAGPIPIVPPMGHGGPAGPPAGPGLPPASPAALGPAGGAAGPAAATPKTPLGLPPPPPPRNVNINF